jgi:hypothetical protein
MSANDLLQELQSRSDGASIDWRSIRERVHHEFDAANTVAERELLLAIFKTTMDYAEATVAKEDLQKFREARRQDYNLLLIKETRVGNNISPERMLEVTAREIAAGRMTEDHELRELSVDACASLHSTHAEMIAAEDQKKNPLFAKQTLGKKLKGLFGK